MSIIFHKTYKEISGSKPLKTNGATDFLQSMVTAQCKHERCTANKYHCMILQTSWSKVHARILINKVPSTSIRKVSTSNTNKNKAWSSIKHDNRLRDFIVQKLESKGARLKHWWLFSGLSFYDHSSCLALIILWNSETMIFWSGNQATIICFFTPNLFFTISNRTPNTTYALVYS